MSEADAPTRPVEYHPRGSDETEPALERVAERRVAGPEDGPQQARTIVDVSDGDDDTRQINCPQDCVSEPDEEQAEIIETVLAPKLAGDDDE
jgi:hypothetical protein